MPEGYTLVYAQETDKYFILKDGQSGKYLTTLLISRRSTIVQERMKVVFEAYRAIAIVMKLERRPGQNQNYNPPFVANGKMTWQERRRQEERRMSIENPNIYRDSPSYLQSRLLERQANHPEDHFTKMRYVQS